MPVFVLAGNVLIVFVPFVLAIHIGAGVYQARATVGVAAGHLPQSAQTVPDQVWQGVTEFRASGIPPAGLLAIVCHCVVVVAIGAPVVGRGRSAIFCHGSRHNGALLRAASTRAIRTPWRWTLIRAAKLSGPALNCT